MTEGPGRMMEGFAPGLFRGRRERALAALGGGAMVLPAAPRALRGNSEYSYRPSSEVFYLSGFTEPDAVVVLRAFADEDRFVLFVRPKDPGAELWNGRRIGPEAAREVFGADACHSIGELDERLPGLLAGADRVHFRLGVAADVESLVVKALDTARQRGARTGSGPRGVVDPGGILDEMRLRKDEAERSAMRAAATLSVADHRAAAAALRPGAGEWQLQADADAAFRRGGGRGPAYETIVGSGENACVLHYVENSCRIGDGDLVLLDAGAEVDLYCGDVTRTYPASGRFTAEQRAVYDVVERARTEAVDAVAPGATIAGVHDRARAVLVDGLIALGVLPGPRERVLAESAHEAFFPHRTSHWLGLDVHDPGDYARAGEPRVLEEGMVLTVEPGLYFRPGGGDGERFRGIGVRIEDDVLVTADGRENLTAALPTDPDEIEALVRG